MTEYCKTHAPSDYVNVKSKRCKEANCSTLSTYGKGGSKLAEYCKTHAPSDYVNVKHKRCKEANCSTLSTYGKGGSKLAEYCKTHAPSDYVNIKSKRCKEANCSTQSHYGIPSYQPEYCAKHKKQNMVLHPTRYKDGYITCQICDIKVHYTAKYCSGCKYYLDNKKTRSRNTKELAIKHLLEENKIKFIHDTIVKGGCSKRRPDFLIYKKWGTIILEIDEYQHNRKNYSCECEITRMKQIYYDEGVQNLLFVRYNPDKYKTIKGQKKYNTIERQQYLIKYLNELTQQSKLGVVYLFYDGFINSPEIENIEVI